MVGKSSTRDIAKAIGTSVPNLHKICHRNAIKLPRDPESYKGGRKKSPITKEKEIESAINLLLENGYRVVKQDPFGKAA